MSQLEVRFTPSCENNEITFVLCQKDDGNFFLEGKSTNDSPIVIPLSQDPETKTFIVQGPHNIQEEQKIINERLVGLTEAWIEASSQGFAINDSVTRSCPKKPGYKPEEIFVENKPFSLKQIIDLIEDGDLELTPDFQRNFVWDKTTQSRLIESIFLGLPLPSIYLNQYDDGRLTIVDGLQRITTIRNFLNNRLTLCNLEYLTECNGKKYNELDGVLSALRLRRVRQTTIFCCVIDYRSPKELKYDLFRRLNRGGKALNDQEMRNCLSREPLQRTLKAMVDCPAFKLATNNSVNDTRMAAQEAALRFIYFYNQYSESNPIGTYDDNMRQTLDNYVDELNTLSEQELSQYITLFSQSMETAHELFGSAAFRKIDASGKKYSVNKLLMLVISVLLAKYPKYKAATNALDNLKQLLIEDEKLNKYISFSTSDKANIKYTFSCLKTNLFDKHLLQNGQN